MFRPLSLWRGGRRHRDRGRGDNRGGDRERGDNRGGDRGRGDNRGGAHNVGDVGTHDVVTDDELEGSCRSTESTTSDSESTAMEDSNSDSEALTVEDSDFETDDTDSEIKKFSSNPYTKFKYNLEIGTGWHFHSNTLGLFRKAERKLPDPVVDLSITYYPGYFVYARDELNPKNPQVLLLHGLFEMEETREKMGKGQRVVLSDFAPTKKLGDKLELYSPELITSTGYLCKGRSSVIGQAKQEIKKHLPFLPFLDVNTYWSTAVDVFEDLELDRLIKYILETAEQRHLLAPANQETHKGWSTMTFRTLVRIAHKFPKIKSGRFRLSFRIFRRSSGIYLRAIVISMTDKMDAANRSRSLVTFEDRIGEKVVTTTLLPFDSLVLLRNI